MDAEDQILDSYIGVTFFEGLFIYSAQKILPQNYMYSFPSSTILTFYIKKNWNYWFMATNITANMVAIKIAISKSSETGTLENWEKN